MIIGEKTGLRIVWRLYLCKKWQILLTKDLKDSSMKLSKMMFLFLIWRIFQSPTLKKTNHFTITKVEIRLNFEGGLQEKRLLT